MSEFRKRVIKVLKDDVELYDIIKESVERDDNIHKYARYITSKIIDSLNCYLTDHDKQLLNTKSSEELKNTYTQSFKNCGIPPVMYISFNGQQGSIQNFALMIETKRKSPKAQISRGVLGIVLEIFAYDVSRGVCLSDLKYLLENLQLLDHEIVHLIDFTTINIDKLPMDHRKYMNDLNYYVNRPSEVHAYAQQLISSLIDATEDWNNKKLDKIKNCREYDRFCQLVRDYTGKEMGYLDYFDEKNKERILSRTINYLKYATMKENLGEDHPWVNNKKLIIEGTLYIGDVFEYNEFLWKALTEPVVII